MSKSRKRKILRGPDGSGTTSIVNDDLELSETDEFIRNSTIDVIKKCLTNNKEDDEDVEDDEQIDEPDMLPNPISLGLKPDIAAMCLPEPVIPIVSFYY